MSWNRFAGLAGLLCVALAAQAEYTSRDDVSAYINEVAEEHEFDAQALRALFDGAKKQQSILDAISRPAERTLKWHEYRNIFIKEQQIERGLEFWRDNVDDLLRAEATYGVPPEYVVAIIGVETRWGRIMGKYRVLDALTTLGFDYPPRSDFFRKELTQFLLLAREEGKEPMSLLGSYAGAMGFGQFIPSSFRAYAVDFDDDGVRDIWTNTTDAIGSVANYFARHGWKHGEETVLKVEVDDPAKVADIVNKGLSLDRTVGELRCMGVKIPDLPNDTKAKLYRMQQKSSDEYYLALNNFYVITRYNRSRLYALAVHQLGAEIKAQRRL